MKKRVTYRPSKAQGAFGAVWGGIFVCIGLFVVIPGFGAFGLLWTFGAIAITVMNVYQAFGKKYAGPEISIEEEDGLSNQSISVCPSEENNAPDLSIGSSARTRLEQLQTLKESGLITAQEYEQKRQEILRQL